MFKLNIKHQIGTLEPPCPPKGVADLGELQMAPQIKLGESQMDPQPSLVISTICIGQCMFHSSIGNYSLILMCDLQSCEKHMFVQINVAPFTRSNSGL